MIWNPNAVLEAIAIAEFLNVHLFKIMQMLRLSLSCHHVHEKWLWKVVLIRGTRKSFSKVCRFCRSISSIKIGKFQHGSKSSYAFNSSRSRCFYVRFIQENDGAVREILLARELEGILIQGCMDVYGNNQTRIAEALK